MGVALETMEHVSPPTNVKRLEEPLMVPAPVALVSAVSSR